ncbi:MAG: hypothetical protein HDT15_11415 [Oscillibacter sp.]|nr:hypothetical protein [Oscillibacter sp.]MBD5155632.1 hypothetical protein [Oscillibacter sp.]
MSDKNVRIMDELMQTIAQTDEWEDIQENDPDIKRADRELVEALREVSSLIPHELYSKLEEAVYSYSNAVEWAAMLYGIHVVTAIRDVSARPFDLSRYIMARTGRATA